MQVVDRHRPYICDLHGVRKSLFACKVWLHFVDENVKFVATLPIQFHSETHGRRHASMASSFTDFHLPAEYVSSACHAALVAHQLCMTTSLRRMLVGWIKFNVPPNTL